MCTVTWFRSPAGYELFFNRDERRTRQPALRPAIRQKGSTRFIAPLDGDFGGTWIAVNERGVCLALLNAYTDLDDQARAPADGFTSRGLLVTALVDSRSGPQAVQRVAHMDLERFRSFLLVVFGAAGDSHLATWSGGNLTIERDVDARMPIVSSSFETRDVCRTRHDLFHSAPPVETHELRQRHLRYHMSHLPERGPRSICMHRTDAHTVSFSHIVVDASAICFGYTPQSPCKGLGNAAPLRLPRPTNI